MSPTLALARFVTSFRSGTLPDRVIHEARRAMLNWTGCAVGASHHATVERVLAARAPFCGNAQASVLGRRERLDILHAALMNGMTSHTFDFDDTHLKTVIHPAGPVASAIVALAEFLPVNGAAFVDAFALGVEVECRIGKAVYPSHYDIGWHITGTAGVFGAAAAAGRLLKLSEQQMLWALGIAATQSSGVREMFGSMCKPFHPGNAARNGLMAALMAQKDFTSSVQSIEARRGFANVLATEHDYTQITDRLGESWELLDNTYKPFACGIVIHPIIDGCVQLRNEHHIKAGDIAAIELKVHPLVLELTGQTAPTAGLAGTFSVYHCDAAAILDGEGGEAVFSDARVADPAIIALRSKVKATVQAGIHEDQADITIRLNDGRVLHRFVEHAIGSLARPMSDADLEAKFHSLCDPVLGRDAAARLAAALWKQDSAANAAAFVPLACGLRAT